MNQSETYAAAGVDIDSGNSFADMIKVRVAEAWPDVGEKIGGFAGGFMIPQGAKKCITGIDGAGIKAILEALDADQGMFVGLGQDATAMAAFDVYAATGMPPSGVLDVLNVAKLRPELHIQIIEDIIKACELSNCRLIGGETAELPDMFPYPWMVNLDVCAFAFAQEESPYVPVEAGQTLYGWPSNGPAANGFSLLRKIFRLKPRSPLASLFCLDWLTDQGRYRRTWKLLDRKWDELGDVTLADALLEPTPIWIKAIEEAKAKGVKFAAHAHITGGGLVDNIPRVLPKNLKAVIRLDAMFRPPIFRLVQERGNISQAEMLRTFNNGVMVASIVSRGGEELRDPQTRVIGWVVPRIGDESQVEFQGSFQDG